MSRFKTNPWSLSELLALLDSQILRSHLLPTGSDSTLRKEPVDVEAFHEERLALLLPAIAEVTGAELPTASAGEVYLDPKTPFSNELAVKRVVRKLSGSVLWWEQHMDRKVLEVLIDDLDRDAVKEVRLLSGPANISPKVKKAFERFLVEVSGAGIHCQWRVVPADRARQLHARVLYDDSTTFELPPLNSVLSGTVDSIRSSGIPREPFEAAWRDPAAVTVDAFEPASR